MTRTHFDHSYFMLFCHRQQSEGYSNMIVEVALRVQHLELFGQHSSYQFLSRSLSVCSSDSNNRSFELVTMMIGKLLQNCEHIIYHDDVLRSCFMFIPFVHNSIGTSFSDCLFCILVAIESGPFESKKHCPIGTYPRIGSYNWMLFVYII